MYDFHVTRTIDLDIINKIPEQYLQKAVLYRFNTGKMEYDNGIIINDPAITLSSYIGFFILTDHHAINYSKCKRYEVSKESGIIRNNLIWFYDDHTIGKMIYAANAFKESKEEQRNELHKKLKSVEIDIRTLQVTVAKLSKKLKEEEKDA